MKSESTIPLVLNGRPITVEAIVDVARHRRIIEINSKALENLSRVRSWVDKVVDDPNKVIYGLNTGLGSLVRIRLTREELVQFSYNVILSHSAGVGSPFPEEVVRATMLLEANTFLKGHSGVRPILPITLARMLNAGVHPIIPSQGSLGASGDLAPLAHLALVFSRNPVGEDIEENSGKASYQGDVLSGLKAMQRAKVERIILGPKEGLSVVNGTHVTAALGALSLYDAKTLAQSADIIASMSLEALLGLRNAFDLRIHGLRPYKGQIDSARNILRLTEGSSLLDSKKELVQDSYSLRCMPQVHGGCREALKYVESVINTEINAVTDSPLVFLDEAGNEGNVLSGGNFHGEPLGYALDTLGLAIAGLGVISERRAYRLTDGNLNRGLPSFLVKQPGVNTGLMIAQYTAASLVSENKVLAHPSTVDSITASENQEDHVSMATFAAKKAFDIVSNVSKVLAIELLCAAQALNFRIGDGEGGNELGAGTKKAWDAFREVVPSMEADRIVAGDIEKATSFILSRELVRVAERAIGGSLD
jgi:histidine ammonia-lyase